MLLEMALTVTDVVGIALIVTNVVGNCIDCYKCCWKWHCLLQVLLEMALTVTNVVGNGIDCYKCCRK